MEITLSCSCHYRQTIKLKLNFLMIPDCNYSTQQSANWWDFQQSCQAFLKCCLFVTVSDSMEAVNTFSRIKFKRIVIIIKSIISVSYTHLEQLYSFALNIYLLIYLKTRNISFATYTLNICGELKLLNALSLIHI